MILDGMVTIKRPSDFRSIAGCWIFILFILSAAAGGCAFNKKMTVVSAASLMEDVAKAANKQSDLRIIREGMPAFLLLLDGMMESWPENDRCLGFDAPLVAPSPLPAYLFRGACRSSGQLREAPRRAAA